MKSVMLSMIRFYWKIIPIRSRKKCLFKESCSQYVYRKTQEGALVGIRALIYRMKVCNGHAELVKSSKYHEWNLLLSNGEVITNERIADHLK